MNRTSALILFLILSICNVFCQAYPVGWTELPNTKLQGNCPPAYTDPSDPANNYDFTQCGGVIGAWSGGFFDTLRNRLTLWGGGHADYSGNELYSLNFGVNPITFTRLNDPTVPPPTLQNRWCTEELSGHTPDPRHTYGSLAYMANTDRMFAYGGALSMECRSEATWTLNIANLQWQRMDPVNGVQPTSVTVVDYAEYDPNSGLVILVTGSNQIFSYNYSTNTYTFLANLSYSVGNSNRVLDPKRKMLFFFGTNSMRGSGTPADQQTNPPQLLALDLSVPGSVSVQNWTTEVTGCGALMRAWAPGLAYDPVIDRIVGWPNFGNTAYIFNPDTKSCDSTSFTSAPQSPPPNIYDGNLYTGGTYGRFCYVPSLDAFAVIYDWRINAFILKLDNSMASLSGSRALMQPVRFAVSHSASGVRLVFPFSRQRDVSVYSVSGKRVAGQKEFTGTELALSKSGLAAGLYIVKVREGNSSGTGKFIIVD